jgi:hypothetical protein
MIVFIIGFILIAIVAWFAHDLIVQPGRELVKVEAAVRILKLEGYNENKAREFLKSKDTDDDGYITSEEFENSKASFDDWLKANPPVK